MKSSDPPGRGPQPDRCYLGVIYGVAYVKVAGAWTRERQITKLEGRGTVAHRTYMAALVEVTAGAPVIGSAGVFYFQGEGHVDEVIPSRREEILWR